MKPFNPSSVSLSVKRGKETVSLPLSDSPGASVSFRTEEIDGGYTDKMSFAFTVSDQKRDIELIDGRTVVTRRITGIRKLYDVSAVSMPANESTSISARSWCDGVIAELEAERLSALEASRRKLALKIKLAGGK